MTIKHGAIHYHHNRQANGPKTDARCGIWFPINITGTPFEVTCGSCLRIMFPISRDHRYTQTLEWHGAEKQGWVARFCGDWIGVYDTQFWAYDACKIYKEKS